MNESLIVVTFSRGSMRVTAAVGCGEELKSEEGRVAEGCGAEGAMEEKQMW